MEGAINIVDAMLVFACGLMLSLISHWDLDIQGSTVTVPIEANQEVTEVDGIRDDMEAAIAGEGDYQKMGTVYVDPKTGKMYMASDNNEDENNEGN